MIDDARTPLIISGPIPRGEEQLFEQFRPNVEVVVNAQKDLCSKLLIEAKKKMASSDQKEVEEGSIQLYRSFKGYPRNKALIKFLSEQGIKAQMLKTEEYFMSENMRHMHEATDELYFVIDEKNNSVELSDKGIDLLTGRTDDPTFFVLRISHPNFPSWKTSREPKRRNRLRRMKSWQTILSKANVYIRSTSY